ncbi:hypothetical protein NPS01_11830 [Nocardioides psychrotolerans]|uniref:Uncharacterized protein n=1 Tax=Nocardioides psychrotolerans TaxID=1005945 RepID=A0A1I3E3X7_9ACTN|nr:hypothetical protein [Nocardioides psychrotolerans]GEP37520.1 hypothetical protein NPS01_11830 [Nocardioides psychrotolerans]SFH93684.1 hypothetical protein SAMN05216561_103209 [Nocardioides psychrotolerans]
MAVGYRSILRLDEREDAVRIAKEQFRSWLVEMVRDPRKTIELSDWNGPGTVRLGPNSVLTVVEQVGEDQLTRLLLDYVETNDDGTWTTRLYATSAPGSRRLKQVLWFEGEGERRDGSPVQPGTPRVVRNTLQAVDAYDGSVPVLSEPRTVGVDDVDDLVGFIEDTHRDLSIVVAAPVPGVPVATWAKAVATLTRDAIGCASFFILEPDAADALNAQLGATHSIPMGAVRTFVPRVVLGDWADARRHRILTARTMSQGLDTDFRGEPRFSERLIRTIAITPRLHLLEAEMAAELTRTVRVLQREQIKPEATPVPEPVVASQDDVAVDVAVAEFGPSWLGKLKGLVYRIAGREAVDEAALQAIADRFEQQEAIVLVAANNAEKLQVERERLEDQVADLRRQLEAEQLERALAEVERRDAEKKARSLERWRAERADKYTYVEEQISASESDPVSVSEIVERLTDPENFGDILKYVELTDVDKAIDGADEIDAADPNGTYASSFWEYVLVLRDYVAECVEHGFSGNLHMYLNSADVHGRKCPAHRHKANESDTVQNNARMRRERTFPVPTEVNPAGAVFMATHFAPTHRDQNAPRMYYAADVAKTKKAYIGYIGVHLSNTRTN